MCPIEAKGKITVSSPIAGDAGERHVAVQHHAARPSATSGPITQ